MIIFQYPPPIIMILILKTVSRKGNIPSGGLSFEDVLSKSRGYKKG